MEQLDEELERITHSTVMPDRLEEMFEALEHDPVLIRESLVRPLLADRLLRRAFAYDPGRHDAARREAAALAAGDLAGERSETVLEETVDAFLVREPATDGEGAPGVVHRIPKESFDDWWSAASEELRQSPMPGALPGGSSSPAVACGPDNVWLPMSRGIAPASAHSAIWTGTHMITWGSGGRQGGLYDPVTDSWRPVSTLGAPTGGILHTAVWTGNRMLIWGGNSSGGRYDPATDTWSPVNQAGAPSARQFHTAVWTGSEMIVWGGRAAGGDENSGGRYDPVADVWSPTSLTGAPFPREGATAVWTGDRMVIWGGVCRFSASGSCNEIYLNSGGLYDPATDSWVPTSMIGAARERTAHTAVWTGLEMLIYGGTGPVVRTGVGRFVPASNSWLPIAGSGTEPLPRGNHLAIWSGERMMVWGGGAGLHILNTGGIYNPFTLLWGPTTFVNAPSPRRDATMVWADGVAIVWGGSDPIVGQLSDGKRYVLSNSPDYDGDGFSTACDCDDAERTVYPGATEICDGFNNDCTHPDWPDLGRVDLADLDDDTFAVCHGDCDDGQVSVFPGAPELCDMVDNDCDGSLSPAELDADHDGWTPCDGDCSDGDPHVYPGALELPGDARDEDCNGQALCDPTATWDSPGAYLTCVTREVNDLVKAGLLSREEGNNLIRRATRLRPQ